MVYNTVSDRLFCGSLRCGRQSSFPGQDTVAFIDSSMW